MSMIMDAGVIACAMLAHTTPARAHDTDGPESATLSGSSAHHARTNAHAPLGVMGDHMHHKGEWMLSDRYMQMNMDGNRDCTSGLSPATIATTAPNRFSGIAGQPPTLRVVPTEMTMKMHMFGAMYAPSDMVTLMVMANYLDKSMTHTTFSGATGTAVLGTFSAQNQGWGDTQVTGLVRLYDDGMNHVHLNAGLSLPTGSLDATGTVLAPSGATPRLRMPYAMQLGTGTWDLLPGITYTGHKGVWGWGAQYIADIHLGKNSEGYAWGDKHRLTAWASREWAPWISTSLRLTGMHEAQISGIDPLIVAPVQTADPDNYGGTTATLGFGVNLLGTEGALKGHRFAIEAMLPVYRRLNGPQLETDFSLVAGWQKAF